jgi:hypothetical protein
MTALTPENEPVLKMDNNISRNIVDILFKHLRSYPLTPNHVLPAVKFQISV